MFRGLLNDAKSAMGSLVAKYLARASVAVPFLIAVGFAIAAITLMLVEQYGHVAAYWIMAGALALFGALAALVVSVKEQQEEAAEQAAENADSSVSTATAAVAGVATQTPVALLGLLSALPMGPASIVPALRLIARNLPLVVLLAATTFLLWPNEETAAGEKAAAGSAPEGDFAEDERPVRHRNGIDPLPSELRH